MLPDQADIGILLARVQNSDLPLSEIQILATEILALRAKETATALFEVLIHQPGEVITTNLLSLFRELAIRSPEWARLLKKSVTKKGRCPRPLVASVREILACDNKKLAKGIRSVRDILIDFERLIEEQVVDEQVEHRYVGGVSIDRRTQWFRSGKVRATIPITMELSDIRHMEDLASIFDEITPIPDELFLDFLGVEHIYVVGLAAMKAWCDKNNISPKVINASDTTYDYLDAIGFTRNSERDNTRLTPPESDYAMAIEPIVSDSKPESVAGKIVKIVDRHMPLSRKTQSGLIVVFAELIENIQRHAGISSPAFACAQVYPQRHKLTICIIDTGNGILHSMMSSSQNSLIQRIEEGELAVRLACSPLITSKPDKHSGYGLYVASELIVRNGGTFRIFSGNEIFTCYRKGWQRKEHLATVSKGWNGTWIAMIVDLDASLLVEDVYSLLPPIPGVQLQDFF